jgi:hypothetical protein
MAIVEKKQFKIALTVKSGRLLNLSARQPLDNFSITQKNPDYICRKIEATNSVFQPSLVARKSEGKGRGDPTGLQQQLGVFWARTGGRL